MALKRIVLRDFVIVSELELDLDTGFSVLTGETGAGKSILIDALQLVTGARADTGVIREGAGRTDVSAEFDTPANVQRTLLEPALTTATHCCCDGPWTLPARVAPGSMAARPQHSSCAWWVNN